MSQYARHASSTRTLYWAATACAVSACLAFAVDLPLARLDLKTVLPSDLRRVLGWAELMAHGIGAAILGIVVFVLDPERRRQIPRLLTSAYLAGLMANGVKLVVARVRPRVFDFQGDVWSTFVGWLPWLYETRGGFEHGFNIQSFPSGHTATAVGLGLGLARIYPRGRWLFLVFALLAALQRIEVGAHYLSDTLAAAALGCLAAAWVGQPRGLGRWFDRWETPDDDRVLNAADHSAQSDPGESPQNARP